MTALPDQDVVKLQTAWLERYRASHRWIIVEGLDGFEVHEHTIDGVAPHSIYPTAAAAAARLLQLMKIEHPVTPQREPERVEIMTTGTEGVRLEGPDQ